MRKDFLLHFFCCTADWRAGIVCIILTAEIFFAVRTKRRIKYDVFRINDSSGMKTTMWIISIYILTKQSQRIKLIPQFDTLHRDFVCWFYRHNDEGIRWEPGTLPKCCMRERKPPVTWVGHWKTEKAGRWTRSKMLHIAWVRRPMMIEIQKDREDICFAVLCSRKDGRDRYVNICRGFLFFKWMQFYINEYKTKEV